MTLEHWVRLLHGPEPEAQKRLARLKNKSDQLMDVLGLPHEPLPPAPNEETERFLQIGMKMYAITAYRKQTDLDLRIASFAVNFFEEELKAKGLIER